VRLVCGNTGSEVTTGGREQAPSHPLGYRHLLAWVVYSLSTLEVLKSTGLRGPWGFESLALRHYSSTCRTLSSENRWSALLNPAISWPCPRFCDPQRGKADERTMNDERPSTAKFGQRSSFEDAFDGSDAVISCGLQDHLERFAIEPDWPRIVSVAEAPVALTDPTLRVRRPRLGERQCVRDKGFRYCHGQACDREGATGDSFEGNGDDGQAMPG
jgi:hypothetical protein